MKQENILTEKPKTSEVKKRGMILLSLILLTLLSFGFIYFRSGSKIATIKAIKVISFSLLGTLLSIFFCAFFDDDKKLSYLFSSLSSGLMLGLLLPIGVSLKYVLISSLSMTLISFIFRSAFKKPVLHPLIFGLGTMYMFNYEGLTSLIDNKSVLTNVQNIPLSDLYTLELSPFKTALKGLVNDGIYPWRLFIGDYFGTIGSGFIIVLVVLMLFLTFYKSLKGSVALTYLVSLYFIFFLSLFLGKTKTINCFNRSLMMIFFSEYVFLSMIISDCEYIEKNKISIYALTILTSGISYVIHYYLNGYVAILLSMVFFQFLYPLFSSINNKAVSITFLILSLIVFALPISIIGIY